MSSTFIVVYKELIFKAVNPGQYNHDVEEASVKKVPTMTTTWTSSPSEPSVLYHNGKVCINTDQGDEALNVNGNIQLTGSVLQPSDKRVKTDITLVITL